MVAIMGVRAAILILLVVVVVRGVSGRTARRRRCWSGRILALGPGGSRLLRLLLRATDAPSASYGSRGGGPGHGGGDLLLGGGRPRWDLGWGSWDPTQISGGEDPVETSFG
jgi:hypothetical protein